MAVLYHSLLQVESTDVVDMAQGFFTTLVVGEMESNVTDDATILVKVIALPPPP